MDTNEVQNMSDTEADTEADPSRQDRPEVMELCGGLPDIRDAVVGDA